MASAASGSRVAGCARSPGIQTTMHAGRSAAANPARGAGQRGLSLLEPLGSGQSRAAQAAGDGVSARWGLSPRLAIDAALLGPQTRGYPPSYYGQSCLSCGAARISRAPAALGRV